MLLAAATASATVRHVPGDFPTIQGAMAASTFGDEVLVDPGTYIGPINVTDGVRLASTAGPEVTIIKNVGSGEPVVTVEAIQEFTTVEGFTITGATYSNPGSGLGGCGVELVGYAHLMNNIIEGNEGGGVHAFGLIYNDLEISGNTIVGNSAVDYGGGIRGSGSVGILNNVIVGNTSGIGGGGVFASAGLGSPPQITGCTIVGNQAPMGAGVLVNHFAAVRHSIIAFNTGNGVELSFLDGRGTSLSISCSDVFGNSGTNFAGMPDPTGNDGNQSADPLFCDLQARDLTISTFSPCAPANSPTGCDLVGALPPVCATVPAVRSTWGQLKARYR
jgi:hypothetical protein